ncbi:hypothetical protein O181_106511 [Austropuccinia psidii MF-1]|uniref:Integrase catalytic domain-containing protein n=1 Tax=Austropuccinia psidii MF-1 TaxID=1389203 RepID=A0A9Q3PNB2_9BASI|nr:hypothetical protein [Austropuccinia psidii MF-1]
MIRSFCAYGLEFKDSNGFTHYWCTLVTALELAYKTSVHSSTGQSPAILEKGWNPRFPADTLRKDLIDINPTASIPKIILDKVKHHAKPRMNNAFDYAKQKWDKSHKVPDFKVGDLVDLFVIVALNGTNAVKVESSGELEKKHPTFPVSLTNPYQPADKELFPLRNPTPLAVPPGEQNKDKKIKKVIK